MIRVVSIVVFGAALGLSGNLEFSKTVGGQVASADAVATDSLRNIYMAGSTLDDGLATAHALQSKRAGGSDAFIAKYTPSGELIWLTYLGGTDVDTATGISVDQAGDVYVCGRTVSHDFPTLHAFQASGTGFVAKINGDGSKLLYSTYLGGSAFDLLDAIAVDASGSAYVTGSAVSTDFPIVNPIQPVATAAVASVFVSKITPNGSTLVYSTRIGGGEGHAIAVDSAGRAYITGATMAADFPVVNAVQLHLQGSQNVFVTKLDSSGSHIVYSTYLGGSGPQTGYGIAVDSAGSAYVTGSTTSVDFPVKSALQPRLNALQAAKSIDGGATWTAITNGLTTTYALSLVIDSNHPATLYVPTYDFGILKSTDGGESWQTVNHGLPINPSVATIAIDPTNSLTLYASVANVGVYKSVDAGANWILSSSGLPRFPNFNFFTFAPGVSSTILVGGNSNGIYRSTDAGATWSIMPVDLHANSYLFDPKTPANQYAGIASYMFSPNVSSPGGVEKSTDGGLSFSFLSQSPPPTVDQLAGIDPLNPSILYGYTSGLAESMNGGLNWIPIGPDIASYGSFGNLVIDPGNPSTIYASGAEGVFRSTNRGATWTKINLIVTPAIGARIAAVDPSNSSTLYALGGQVDSDAFVAKFDAAGALVYSTYLGGSGDEISHGIAIGPHGEAVITGSTSSTDWPLAHPLQRTFGGGVSYDLGDFFVAELSADGSVLDFSTYLGDSNLESAHAVAVDWEGAIVIVGQTSTTASTQGAIAKVRQYRGTRPRTRR